MMTHYWFLKRYLPERNGQNCRITGRARNGSIRVEFADGFTVITQRFAVRKIKEQ